MIQKPESAVQRALELVRAQCPEVTHVAYDREGRWMYFSDDHAVPRFSDAVDVAVLEDAADEVANTCGFPAIFYVDPVAVLVAEINTRLGDLRTLITEPVCLVYAEGINIEVRPLLEDDRISVLAKGRGFTCVNYTHEGVVVDVVNEDADILDDMAYDNDALVSQYAEAAQGLPARVVVGANAAGIDPKLLDDLCRLEGLPPYDQPGNYVRHDGLFAKSIRDSHPLEQINAARSKLGLHAWSN